jgi:uncharacterized membrane protein
MKRRHQPSDLDKPLSVRVVQGVEASEGLDAWSARLHPLAQVVLGSHRRRDLLQGRWLGHALHPVMTDLPIGFWMSSTVLDLWGGMRSREAAQLLLGCGVISAVPTAVTGLAEWGSTGRIEQRVGVVHAGLNATALLLYAASWFARRGEPHGRAVRLALAGGAMAAAGGFLGGHLESARKVSSHHPAFDED